MNWKMIFFLFLGLSFVNPVLAVTEADYYNTGLKFFTAKNYPQAIQYFGAALSLDPHNSPALQGRADSYYELGRYAEALRDYEAVKALKPSDQTVMELGPPDELSQRIPGTPGQVVHPLAYAGNKPASARRRLYRRNRSIASKKIRVSPSLFSTSLAGTSRRPQDILLPGRG